jgi:nucleoside-diphosphate-sugar epimerase
MSARSAVTGSTGCLGRALVARLETTAPVRVLARTPSAHTEALRARGHEIVPGDLDDPAALDALVAGVDVVYHCAARLGNGDAAASRRVNVGGTALLAEACVRAGVRRLVYVSSISVFSATESAGGVIDESREPGNIDALCIYSRTKYEGERAVRRIAGRSGLEFTIVRPTNVYGPWSRPWFLGWADLVRRLPVAFGNLRIDVVHADDVADALVRAGSSPATANATLHIGADVVKMRDFIGRVGAVVGRKPRRLPDGVDYVARYVAAHAFRIVTGTVTAMPLLRESSYPHSKAERSIGYLPRIGLDEGFARMARWYEAEYLPHLASEDDGRGRSRRPNRFVIEPESPDHPAAIAG